MISAWYIVTHREQIKARALAAMATDANPPTRPAALADPTPEQRLVDELVRLGYRVTLERAA